ncbi:hypothetical protein W822_09925 [Advenella kashmirensis W13003]|uniref:Uncharacterized protein n=1 Tax=Advenella kashmirensis W13003 TaxID=1424334 RepID=V8QWY2_9BURK|nr:hypothetical protein W822_09925 [Advenella kashmirensis W13003]
MILVLTAGRLQQYTGCPMGNAIGKQDEQTILSRSKVLQRCTMHYLRFTDLDEQTNGK